MVKNRKWLALLLTSVMALGCIGGACMTAMAEEAATEGEAAAVEGETPLVVGYSEFSSKFSPFFAESAYDQDAQDITQLPPGRFPLGNRSGNVKVCPCASCT